MAWDQDRIDMLEKLWAEGLSATLIAMRMNAAFHDTFSRNAVIGKAHRMGLTAHSRTEGLTNKIFQRSKKRKTEKPKRVPNSSGSALFRKLQMIEGVEATETVADVDIPLAERKSLLDLEPNDCRWVVGDPQHPFPQSYFCGRKKVPGLPYCPDHCRRAYVVPDPERSRPRKNGGFQLPQFDRTVPVKRKEPQDA